MDILNSIILQTSTGAGGGFSGLIMIAAMIAIFYFFMIRPQSKKQKAIKKAREAMAVGDRVITAGGVYGRIRAIEVTTFIIEISKGVEIKIEKSSVYPYEEDPAKK